MLDIADDHRPNTAPAGLLLLLFEGFRLEIDEPLQGVNVLTRDPGDLSLQVLVAPIHSFLFAVMLDLKLVEGVHHDPDGRGAVLNDEGGKLKAFLQQFFGLVIRFQA